MEFSNSITIARPAHDVFAYLAAFENVPRWNHAITETQKTSPGPVGVGATYRQTRSIPSPASETFTVTRFEPDHDLAIEGTIGPFEGTLSYHLEPAGDATVLTNDAHLKGRGVAALAAPIASGRIRAAVAQNLEVLKTTLEAPSR